jgi:hypothetical protein
MAEDSDFLRPMVRTVIQEFLEAEMAEADRRAEARAGRRSPKQSQRLLCAQPDYTSRKARVARAPRSQWTLFYRDFRALSAQREAGA